MARSKKIASDAPASADDALSLMRKRYEEASEFYASRYDESREDVLFVDVPGNQWDAETKKRRANRRCYEFPKLRGHVINVVNEMRQSRPQGKVRGKGEDDRGLAELMQGITRDIESSSNADHAYDIAFDFAVKGGFGDWRICTDYLRDDDFEQDIRITPIRNPFSSKPDIAAVEIDLRDARYWFLEDLVPKSEFERLYPKANMVDFDNDAHCGKLWREADNVRVCEYWYKEPMKREVWALSDGRVVVADELADKAGVTVAEAEELLAASQVTVDKRRTVDGHKVFMRMTNGHEWLTEPYAFLSKYIPIVRTWGNIQMIDGVSYWSGLVRFAKDQQRLHNLHRTALVEAIAKAPKAPYVATPAQTEGFEEMWRNANAEDYPVIYYNETDKTPGPPKRTEQAQVPVALIQAAGMDNDDIKASTGQFNASLGQTSNETSGRAINARKQQGATSTFNFIDNLAYAIRYSTEIVVDMIPRVYDTQRVVRILGEDGGAKFKTLYQEMPTPDGKTVVVNDIKKGKYDVTVTVGPSYATQRMEAADAFAQMAGQIGNSLPQLGPLLAYAVIQNQDLPGMEAIDGAIRKVLVGQGLLEPKEGEAPPPPQRPDPRAEADARKAMADAALSEAKAAQAQGEASMTPFQIRKLIEDTLAVHLQNLQAGGQMVAALPPPPMPMPGPPMQLRSPSLPPESMQPIQPPQGGFFSPDGLPSGPQFTG
jgi:hypothetical protein